MSARPDGQGRQDRAALLVERFLQRRRRRPPAPHGLGRRRHGVLFLDVNGDNKITSQDEIDFTDWDPSVKSEMAALEQVFDTNHDGKLDAGDADWSLFKVMVTNPNGATSVKTLAQLGIASINLTPDTTSISEPDGSSINDFRLRRAGGRLARGRHQEPHRTKLARAA